MPKLCVLGENGHFRPEWTFGRDRPAVVRPPIVGNEYARRPLLTEAAARRLSDASDDLHPLPRQRSSGAIFAHKCTVQQKEQGKRPCSELMQTLPRGFFGCL
jgi:hypothetical protein